MQENVAPAIEPQGRAPVGIIGPIPALRDEEAARRSIRRNRALATGLLALTAIAFGATWLVPNPGFWTLLLRAGAEAGIVGGLADWFAVTALFRHPLGLPIPHTAILPRNKDRIGRALAAFVERSFLTSAVLVPRLRAAEPGRRLAAWLSQPDTAPLIAEPVAAALPGLVRVVQNRDLREFLNQAVGEQLREVNLAPLVGRTIEVLTRSGEADILFERGIDLALGWIEANRAEIDQLVQERSRWWMPRAIDRRITDAIVEGVTDVLNGLRRPDSATRIKFQDALATLIDRLIHSPEQKDELNAAKDRLLRHPDVQAWLNAVWTELSEALAADLAHPSSRTRAVLEKAITSIGQALAADAGAQAKIDETLEHALEKLIGWRGEIARFMTDVIRGWDAHTLADRLELVIGSDLQYIRMNGTVVGALVGCLLFLAAWALGASAMPL